MTKATPKKKNPATKRKIGSKKIGKKVTAMVQLKRPTGRPTKLTPAKIKAIAGHIEEGNFAVTACALEDVVEQDFYHWLDLGKRDAREGKLSVFRSLSESIKKASAVSESKCVKAAIAGENGWQAQMTWLERRFPDRWGQQSKLNMEEARDFVHRVMGALAVHIADKSILGKIVEEVRGVQIERRGITHTK